MAEAGVFGNGWLNWITCELPGGAWCTLVVGTFAAPLGTIDCIVVSVVVSERTEGAGDREGCYHRPGGSRYPRWRCGSCLRLTRRRARVAIIEGGVSCSVDTVGGHGPGPGSGWGLAVGRGLHRAAGARETSRSTSRRCGRSRTTGGCSSACHCHFQPGRTADTGCCSWTASSASSASARCSVSSWQAVHRPTTHP